MMRRLPEFRKSSAETGLDEPFSALAREMKVFQDLHPSEPYPGRIAFRRSRLTHNLAA